MSIGKATSKSGRTFSVGSKRCEEPLADAGFDDDDDSASLGSVAVAGLSPALVAAPFGGDAGFGFVVDGVAGVPDVAGGVALSVDGADADGDGDGDVVAAGSCACTTPAAHASESAAASVAMDADFCSTWFMVVSSRSAAHSA